MIFIFEDDILFMIPGVSLNFAVVGGIVAGIIAVLILTCIVIIVFCCLQRHSRMCMHLNRVNFLYALCVQLSTHVNVSFKGTYLVIIIIFIIFRTQILFFIITATCMCEVKVHIWREIIKIIFMVAKMKKQIYLSYTCRGQCVGNITTKCCSLVENRMK